MRLRRTFIRLSSLFIHKLLPELCTLCCAACGMFLLCAADRVGLVNVWNGAIPGWIKVTTTTVLLSTLSMNVRDLLKPDVRELVGTMLLFAAAIAPSGYVGLTCSFRKGGILFGSMWTAIGTTAVVLHPLYIAVTFTSLREGDILVLSMPGKVRVWVLLKPIGDGRGLLLLASQGSSRTLALQGSASTMASQGSARTLSERRLLSRNLPCTEIHVAGRLGIVELVKLVWNAAKTASRRQDELRVLAFSLQRPVRVIQRAWRRAHADPGYSLCRTRLLREVAEIDDDPAQLRATV
jgi:hypothetical protein